MAMNWAQVTQKKQQQAQVYVSTISFYIHAYISTLLTTVLNFSYSLQSLGAWDACVPVRTILSPRKLL